jgi:3-methyladenine DNA glycosylase/8-oxoguanine DNA glycosylase
MQESGAGESNDFNQQKPMELQIATPSTFSFKRTVISHGWCELLPFEFSRKNWRLTRVIEVGKRPPVTVVMSATKRLVRISPSRKLAKKEAEKVLRDCRHILRLDDNLESFYLVTSNEPDFDWIAKQGAGRMLRSPTVFEDLVKMICTTNCSWGLTEKMVTGLVRNLGHISDEGRRAFPTPEAMANMPLKFFVDEVRAGYRAPYLLELSERVASGALNVEQWLKSPLSTADLVNQIKSVKGAGDYAAENLLKLLGRYDGLALDSWTRAKFFEIRNRGRKASDKKIARYYARFKEWRGLALWCDMTRDWLE